MKVIDGGITSAKGFFAAGGAAGIKKNGSADMAMIYSEVPAEAAGTFTTNVVKAAPVIWDRDIVRSGGLVQAVVINSGVANACTGQLGLSYCRQTAEAAAENFGIDPLEVLVASTGVIGQQIPIDKITAGCGMLKEKLGSTREDGLSCAKAIMTTDTVSKEAA